jgi:hypothetical protein
VNVQQNIDSLQVNQPKPKVKPESTAKHGGNLCCKKITEQTEIQQLSDGQSQFQEFSDGGEQMVDSYRDGCNSIIRLDPNKGMGIRQGVYHRKAGQKGTTFIFVSSNLSHLKWVPVKGL